MFRCFGMIFFLIEKKWQSPQMLICLCSSPGRNWTEITHLTHCSMDFFFCSAAFFWKWNQDKLGNWNKCCNSTSNRYWCAVRPSYRGSICPFITISDWLSLHKETEATGTNKCFCREVSLLFPGNWKQFSKALDRFAACLLFLSYLFRAWSGTTVLSWHWSSASYRCVSDANRELFANVA